MVGDWIKIRSDLYRDPKVCLIADCLLDNDGQLARHVNRSCGCDMAVTRNVMRNVTVGALVAVWGVTRHRGKRDNDDLVLKNATLSVVDDIADLPGFGEAMAAAGWVIENDIGIVFPNFFEEFNSDPSEEARKRNAARQRRYREKQRNVTVTSQSNVREEKSRVEKNKKPPKSPKGDKFDPKQVELPFSSIAFRIAWCSWCDNRAENRKALKPTGTTQQLKNLQEMGEARAIAAITHSVANGYQGIYEPSPPAIPKSPPPEPEPPKRTFYIAGVTNAKKGDQP